MLVKFLKSISSSEGWSFRCNEVAEIENSELPRWIAAGICTPLETETIQTATAQPVIEQAVARGRKGHKR